MVDACASCLVRKITCLLDGLESCFHWKYTCTDWGWGCASEGNVKRLVVTACNDSMRGSWIQWVRQSYELKYLELFWGYSKVFFFPCIFIICLLVPLHCQIPQAEKFVGVISSHQQQFFWDTLMKFIRKASPTQHAQCLKCFMNNFTPTPGDS